MILVVDNYDSFTYNLVQIIGALGAPFRVWRNDQFALREVSGLNPSRIIVSPGPGRPEDAGMVPELLREYVPRVPVLGICLGHHALAYINGGKIVQAELLMHGKTSPIHHWGEPIFEGVPPEFTAARYHSLTVLESSLPSCLRVICRDHREEIMGMAHREYPAVGLQFHPESVATPHGERLLANFIKNY